MYQAPEQFAAMNKANLEAATRFAHVAFGGAERLIEIQMRATKAALVGGADTAKTLASIKDMQGFADVKDTVAQPAMEQTADYVKSVYDVATETQAEFGKLIDTDIEKWNKVAKPLNISME